MKLANQIAVVTGATSGIGKAISLLFAKEGATIAAIGRDKEKGLELIREIESENGKAFFYQADLRKSSLIEPTVQKVLQNIGTPKILINCAGIATEGTVESLSLDAWDEIFNINVTATFLFCKYLVPIMKEQGGGKIVNIGSTAGTVGAWNLHAYSATKGAIIQLSKSMGAEYGKDNIRVNCLCPGGTITPMIDELCANGEVLENFTNLFPMKRLAQPEEIAKAALFLASDESSFITGTTLLVDGGFTAV